MSTDPSGLPAVTSEPFNEVERAAWSGLIGIHGRLMQEVAEDLRVHSGITHQEFEVLLRLYYAPERKARIQELAGESLLTASGMSRVVSRLTAQQLVRRSRASEDGRGAYAELTGRGASLFESASTHHMRFVRDQFLSRFTAEELRTMADLWQRMDDEA